MTGFGRPTLYKPEYAERARELCARGAINPHLAAHFGVARSTVGEWIAKHPEFAEAVQQGRDAADAVVIESLFTRATGYDRKVERAFLYRGDPRTVTYTLHVPAETRACMFWLRNRRPEDWMESVERARDEEDDEAWQAELAAARERVRRAREQGGPIDAQANAVIPRP